MNSEYLSLKQTNQIKALACIGIILHHVTQQVTGYGSINKGPVTVFNYAGFLFTGLFFFFSGYGLVTSLLTKKDYLRSFPAKRFPAVLIPFYLTNLLILLVNHFVYGYHQGTLEMLSDLFGFTLINSFGWFIIEITILYLAFYLFFLLIKKRGLALLLLIFTVFLMILYAFLQGHDPEGSKAHWFKGEWWYNSTIVFVFGLLYAYFRNKLEGFFRKHCKVLLCAAAILFVLAFSFSIYAVNRYGYYQEYSLTLTIKKPSYFLLTPGRQYAAITLFSQEAAGLLFAALILLISMKVTLNSKVLSYLGSISLELFLVHGYIVTTVFGNMRLGDFARYILVFVCSIACAALMSPVIKWVVRFVTSHLDQRKVEHDTLEAAMAKRKQKQRMKVLGAVILTAIAAILVLGWLSYGRRLVFAKKEYEEEMAALKSSSIGDEVCFGYYEMDPKHLGKERLPWIVLKEEGNVMWLLSRYGIAGSVYYRKHEEVTWEASDIRNKLNSEEFTSIFSCYELQNLVSEDGDLLTLLTAEEAREFFENDHARELDITAAAELDGTNVNILSKHHEWDLKGYRSSWWWLKGKPGEKKITAPIVDEDGVIREDWKAVNKPYGAVRPLIRVCIQGE